jgi:RNA polymerase sigma factor (sigma-70 family)
MGDPENVRRAEIAADFWAAMPSSRRMDRTDASDEVLARLAGTGDDDAFGVLFERYHGRLELYCRSIVRHDEDARDAAQNAMAKALVGLRRHDGELQVRPWLYRIAHNEAISLLRGRRQHAILDDELGGIGRDPVDDLISRERLAQTFDSVRELPGEQRQALLLRELMGLSHEEIGAAIGTSAVRAKHVVFRARAALSADASASEEDCSRIRRLLGDGDGRRRRSRVVRGHLRCCGPCRAWDDARRPRGRRRLVAFPAALGSWLVGVVGGAGGGAAGVAGTAKVAASIAVVAATVTPLAEDVTGPPPASRGTVTATASASAAATPRVTAARRVRPVATPTATAVPVKATVPATAKPRAVSTFMSTATAGARPRRATEAPAPGHARRRRVAPPDGPGQQHHSPPSVGAPEQSATAARHDGPPNGPPDTPGGEPAR